MSVPAVKKPFVGQAPVLNEKPATDDWGQITRPIIDEPVAIEGTVGGTPVEVTGSLVVTPEARPTTADVQAIPAAAIVTILSPANPNRRGLTVYNDSNRAMYVKLGAGAALNSWTTKLYKDDWYEIPSPVYVGVVTGIWEAGVGGRALVTETRP